jgi:hypothetical protein
MSLDFLHSNSLPTLWINLLVHFPLSFPSKKKLLLLLHTHYTLLYTFSCSHLLQNHSVKLSTSFESTGGSTHVKWNAFGQASQHINCPTPPHASQTSWFCKERVETYNYSCLVVIITFILSSTLCLSLLFH